MSSKPVKVQAYQLSDGSLGTREQALKEVRQSAIVDWLRSKPSPRALSAGLLADFLARNGEELRVILNDTLKAVD